MTVIRASWTIKAIKWTEKFVFLSYIFVPLVLSLINEQEHSMDDNDIITLAQREYMDLASSICPTLST